MNAERTQAYARVMTTLSELGPSKLWPDEQERIRHAADTLIFSSQLTVDAQDALADAACLCQHLVASGRWQEETADRLAVDVGDCGPKLQAEFSPA